MKHIAVIVAILLLTGCSTPSSSPTITISISEDEKSGYNIHIQTTNFTWAPEHATSAHREGEGHAHIYINDKKISRVYAPWYYLPQLPRGENEIKVTLSQNNHDEYVVENKLISDTKKLTVKGD
jgi:hypothetical protein